MDESQLRAPMRVTRMLGEVSVAVYRSQVRDCDAVARCTLASMVDFTIRTRLYQAVNGAVSMGLLIQRELQGRSGDLLQSRSAVATR